MFDISFTELMLVGVVALVVIGPERLPKVARTVGHLLGRAQRYVSDVKTDIQREIDLDEMTKLKKQMDEAASSLQASMRETAASVQEPMAQARDSLHEASASVEDLIDQARSEVSPATGSSRSTAAAPAAEPALATAPGSPATTPASAVSPASNPSTDAPAPAETSVKEKSGNLT